MTYGFPKISFFIGLLLTGLIVAQIMLPKVPQLQSDSAMTASIQVKVNSTMCSGKYPATIQNMLKQFPDIDSNILLIIGASAIALTFLFNLIPQNGFFSWALIHLFTLSFIVTAFGAFYLFSLTPSTTCTTVKTMILNTKQNATIFEFIKNNEITKKLVSFIPHYIMDKIHIFAGVFVECVNKLGVTAPIFVIVIAFYLINKETRSVTRFEVLALIGLIVSAISALGYYKATSDYVFAGVFTIASIVLALIVVNLALNFGYIFVSPAYLFGCYVLSYRLLGLCLHFKIPFELQIAVGFFVFLFANTFIWTKNGTYLTVVFLLNYGLSTLCPLPADSLIVLVFLLYIFTYECCKCKKTCKKVVKQKTD
ncbi:hypothetical protein EDI_166160 [Entamoeba dispar SAW760]|uniref:Uncharacterized protein n=1 Tax=Entamoeba dispar (strain ATCC PRA-260 / SAW760) TaxID=370354 RepID=B0EAE2_ENTDS|nr:uncharacterized protein EDI_166160 [Entamoeba dispar SAW760]EDR28496.1 hypothetical protein EDI_166160 [Entamoeba dispar SAW760]|eukprot:EDR28496.1 hypothetical protein EDI_166160 [Entamoeba dispar SAW760]